MARNWKTQLGISLTVGAFISAALIVIEPLTNFEFLSLEMPGISAAYLFWGAVGGTTAVGIAIAWLVNALFYGLVALPLVWIVFYVRERVAT